MKSTLLIFLFCFVLFVSMRPEPTTLKRERFVSVADLIKEGKVQAKFFGVGIFQGNCILMKVKNNTTDTVWLLLEPGRRLLASDSIYQDILVAKTKRLQLLPWAETTTQVYGFCCQAHDHTPIKDLSFSVGYMAPPSLIKLAQVIDQHDFPITAAQASVWILSDHLLPASLYNEDPNEIRLLKQTLGEILGIKMPWYAIEYEKDNILAYSGRHLRVSGTLNYSLNQNTLVTITVRSKSGRLAKILMNSSPASAGTHAYDVNLIVKDWPKGQYTIFVHQDNANLNMQTTFEL